jgi:hypothetical protein
MSVRGQTWPHVHERGAFDTPPHFVHSQGTGTKCILHATRGNLAFIQGAWLGMQPACEVWSRACHVRDRRRDMLKLRWPHCHFLFQSRALSMGLKAAMSGGFNAASR